MSGMPDSCSGFRGQGLRVQGFRVQAFRVQASLEWFDAKVRQHQRRRERQSVVQGFLPHKNPPPQDPTVALCLGTYDGPGGGGVLMCEVPL